MSLEDSVADILATLDGQRSDYWGRQAASLAEGIRQSGLAERVDAASERSQSNMAGLAAVIGVSGEMIAFELSRSNYFLSQIADALRDPLATAANERFRIGRKALKKGWNPEAIEEFKASIELYRIHAPSHAALGTALMNEHRPAEAAVSFALAVRYFTPDDPAMATGCALQAAAALDSIGDSTKAIQLLSEIQKTYPECAEVAFVYARMSRDTSQLRSAVMNAPDLIVPALAADIPDVEQIAEEITRSEDGPVALARQFRDRMLKIRKSAPGWTLDYPVYPVEDFERLDVGSTGEIILAANELLGKTQQIANLTVAALFRSFNSNYYLEKYKDKRPDPEQWAARVQSWKVQLFQENVVGLVAEQRLQQIEAVEELFTAAYSEPASPRIYPWGGIL
jgi:tetratricopeptide (TPR) repeat protein